MDLELNPDLLARRAQYHPDRTAVVFRHQAISYGELDARVERCVGQLANLGLAPGDRVGILAENHVAYLDLLFATARTGVILTAYNYRLAQSEIDAIVHYTSPRALVVGDGLKTDAFSGPTLKPDEISADASPAGLPKSSRLRPAAMNDTSMLVFTGGTTGLPKAARISHRQIVLNAVNTVFGWGLGREDACAVVTPMFHAALHAMTTPLLHVGGKVLIEERFDPQRYLGLIQEERPTLLFMVPTMYQMLVDQPRFSETDLSCVRWAISGGAPCPEPVRESFNARGVSFRQGYGLTECGVNCFVLESDEASRHPLSVGRPMPHLHARLVSEDGEDVTQSQVGELWLSGPVVMDGYYERPDATAEVLVEDQGRTWLRTGDLARQDEGGRYFIVGRRKEMFISGGENIYPAEIERALYEHDAVAECAVVGIKDDRWGEIGLAAVVLKGGAELSGDDLKAFLQQRLAKYKVPKRWAFRDALPKSGAGKILRRAIVEEHGATD